MSKYVSRAEAAAILGVSERTIDRYILKNLLPKDREGRVIVVPLNAVEKLKNASKIVLEGSLEPVSDPVVVKPEKAAPDENIEPRALATPMGYDWPAELAEKNREIAKLHYQLGRLEAKLQQSVPLLEMRQKEDTILRELNALRQDHAIQKTLKQIYLVLAFFVLLLPLLILLFK